MESEKFSLIFDGTGDVEKFIVKCNLHCSLKGHGALKSAQFLGSRLEGRAFDVYMRLCEDDKKNPIKIKEELLKEFQRGNQDRDVAIHELSSRSRLPQETPQTFAYKLIELVKLAYPDFADNVQLTIAKDFFIKGVHSEMQVALKSLSHFKDCDINTLAKETVRLELAGVKSQMHLPPPNVNNVDEEKSLVDAIANKVMDKIENLSLEANQISRGQNRYQRGRNNANRGRRGNNRQPPRCRSFQVSGHVVRDCPTRFCQACGGKGHDAWQRSCPNYI